MAHWTTTRKNKFETLALSRTGRRIAQCGNFTYQHTDLLTICEETSTRVPDVEINLLCTEPESSLDDIWDEPGPTNSKQAPRNESPTPPPLYVLQEPPARSVPPNSPVEPGHRMLTRENPFVSYLLRIWNEQRFNSPRLHLLSESVSVQQEIGIIESPALVFREPETNSLISDVTYASASNEDDHIVPDFDIGPVSSQVSTADLGEEDSEEDSSQRSRILFSCPNTDHTVPVFLEE